MKTLAYIYVLSFLSPDATHDVALYMDAVQCETAREAAVDDAAWLTRHLFCFPTINDGYNPSSSEAEGYASLPARTL